MSHTLSIIIPFYNEESHIEKLISRLLEVNFKEVFTEVEFIAVDDGSTDKSLDVIQNLSTRYSILQYIKLSKNSGKGAAIKAGFELAKGDYFIVQDADLELIPNDILKLGKLLIDNELELVNGSRFYNNKLHKENKNIRNFANSFFSGLASVVNGTRITDLTCGYKLFTRNFYENIELKEKRFGIEAELLTKALKFNKKKVKEHPVQYFPREIKSGKKIRYSDGFRVIWACLKYKFIN